MVKSSAIVGSSLSLILSIVSLMSPAFCEASNGSQGMPVFEDASTPVVTCVGDRGVWSKKEQEWRCRSSETPDGGSICVGSIECDGYCHLPNMGADAAAEVNGVCSNNYIDAGCFQFVEGGRALPEICT